MTRIKDAPRTSTTIIVRSDAHYRISQTRNPYLSLMQRVFQEESTAKRGQKFLIMVEDRQKSGKPIKTSEWKNLLKELEIDRSSFYGMRNKLLGAGMITHKKGEYRVSGQFSTDLMDMAKWWRVAVLHEDPARIQS